METGSAVHQVTTVNIFQPPMGGLLMLFMGLLDLSLSFTIHGDEFMVIVTVRKSCNRNKWALDVDKAERKILFLTPFVSKRMICYNSSLVTYL